ncbi:redox-sensing transcriptional repressor Rex [Planctomyces sp. SH-PL62]|uniref:redox-sensing transcriptional repressor Rex n=1 Tax=Planctomyces sp. SH-PL62 TaxID=1636152 RepID=UPI00078D0EE6|nr:redox-sensing transcriptional repressor Rex [Planctomyces sp. SH-PL62]AMV39528.1 Redox-sensing transcriptional repressor Rex [Planctomyces sp. SH-PL62]
MNPSRNGHPNAKPAPKAVVGRVSLYLRQLESLQREGLTKTSSHQLGEPFGIKNAQVRKDLAFFGQFGRPGVGYDVTDLILVLRRILGVDKDWPLILVGLGNLGRALLRYRGFQSRRFHIVAIFDTDPRKVGQVHQGVPVEPLDELARSITAHKVSLALLCVPAEAAQAVADQMIDSGIRGILNFAPVPLAVPPRVSVIAVDLSIQLENLAYKVQGSLDGVSWAG